MALERERKFLLKEGVELDLAQWEKQELIQGYLMLDRSKGKQLRVRVSEGIIGQAWMTYKQDIDLTDKAEYEVKIKPEEARRMLQDCNTIVKKTRYNQIVNKQLVSLDVYPDGMKVIEVEANYEGEFIIPEFCGEEVTGQVKYSNIVIALKNQYEAEKRR